MNYQAAIQGLSAQRASINEAAAKAVDTNQDQARALWAASDALVVAMEQLSKASDLADKAELQARSEAAKSMNPWDLLA